MIQVPVDMRSAVLIAQRQYQFATIEGTPIRVEDDGVVPPVWKANEFIGTQVNPVLKRSMIRGALDRCPDFHKPVLGKLIARIVRNCAVKKTVPRFPVQLPQERLRLPRVMQKYSQGDSEAFCFTSTADQDLHEPSRNPKCSCRCRMSSVLDCRTLAISCRPAMSVRRQFALAPELLSDPHHPH